MQNSGFIKAQGQGLWEEIAASGLWGQLIHTWKLGEVRKGKGRVSKALSYAKEDLHDTGDLAMAK